MMTFLKLSLSPLKRCELAILILHGAYLLVVAETAICLSASLPFSPGYGAHPHFPAQFKLGGVHVTGLWPIECEPKNICSLKLDPKRLPTQTSMLFSHSSSANVIQTIPVDIQNFRVWKVKAPGYQMF